MAQLTMRVSDEDKTLINNYAKFYNLSTSEFLRKIAIDHIENSIDSKLYHEAIKALDNANDSILSFDEVMHNLGLDNNVQR